MIFLFSWVLFRFHVKFQGSIFRGEIVSFREGTFLKFNTSAPEKLPFHPIGKDRLPTSNHPFFRGELLNFEAVKL